MTHESNRNLLIVDDDADSLKLHSDLLAAQAYNVFPNLSPLEALNVFQNTPINVALIDFELGVMTGTDLAKQLLLHNPDVQIIIFTAYGAPEKIIEAQRTGIRDFVSKPIDNYELLIKIDNAFSYYNERLKRRTAEDANERLKDHLIGENNLFISVLNDIFELAPTDNTVLLYGETGTGKEIVAQAIHRRSMRAKKSLIVVNCPAITDSISESALFGFEKGAFTGADKQTKGYFEAANQGTIFLDEIGDLSDKVQADLLRVLASKRINRVGSHKSFSVDFRLIAATNRDLPKAVKERKFRSDLFFRINTFSFTLPPLRNRAEDIPILADFFLRTISKYSGALTEPVKEKLQGYHYPGNVRELESVLMRAVQRSKGNSINADHISFDTDWEINQESDITGLYRHKWNQAKSEFEKRYLSFWYRECNGNIKKMSEKCMRDRSDLHRKLILYNIKQDQFGN